VKKSKKMYRDNIKDARDKNARIKFKHQIRVCAQTQNICSRSLSVNSVRESSTLRSLKARIERMRGGMDAKFGRRLNEREVVGIRR